MIAIFAYGLGVVSSFGPPKIELAPARKHSACVSSLIVSRPADSRTIDFGMVMRATAIVRTKSMRVRRLAVAQRRAFDLHQHVDRHAFGMDGQGRERMDHADAVLAALAHADDAAAADIDAGVAHFVQRVEAVLIGPRA